MEAAAEEEEAKDKSIKADFVKAQLKKRLGENMLDGTRSAPALAGSPEVVAESKGDVEAEEDIDEEGKENRASLRSRASEFPLKSLRRG